MTTALERVARALFDHCPPQHGVDGAFMKWEDASSQRRSKYLSDAKIAIKAYEEFLGEFTTDSCKTHDCSGFYDETYTAMGEAANRKTAKEPLYLHGDVVTETWDAEGNETVARESVPAIQTQSIEELTNKLMAKIEDDSSEMENNPHYKGYNLGLKAAIEIIRQHFASGEDK